jgi:DNA ligase (NAD+)
MEYFKSMLRAGRVCWKKCFFSASSKRVKPDNSEEVAALKELLRKWSDAYYNSSSPEVSDEQFDALRARLAALDPQGVDERVGAPPSASAKRHRHAAPMLSLRSTRQMEELDSFHETTLRLLEVSPEEGESLRWTTEYKYDGMALALLYDEAGVLQRAVTRGDGEVGEEIPLERLRPGVVMPARIDTSVLAEPCEVRGELLVPRREFEELRTELGYRSARNAVVGLLRNERPPDNRLPLRFVAYSLDAEKVRAADYHLRIALLKELGFEPCPFWKLHFGWSKARASVIAMAEQRTQLEYETDGVVVKLNSRRMSDSLGSTRHHPKHSMAFKWSALSLPVTTLQRIEWQTDQSGCLRPVAVVDPAVTCEDGATLTRASLHNWAFVARHGLVPGVAVQMERAGGTVPHLVPFPVDAVRQVLPPPHCPCQEKAAVVEDDPPLNLRCSKGLLCPERIAYRAYAVGAVLQIKGLGLASTRQLAHAKLLSSDNAWDILRLSQSQLESLQSGWGPVKAEKVAREIAKRVADASYEQTLGTLFISSGVGPSVLPGLADAYPSLELLARASEADLATLPEVGVLSASVIHQRVNSETVAKLTRELKEVGLPVAAAARSSLHAGRLPLRSMQIAVTGTLTVPRSQLAEQVRALGGSVVAGVSGKTSVLVVGMQPTQDKIDKAKRLSVPVEDEETFRNRFS